MQASVPETPAMHINASLKYDFLALSQGQTYLGHMFSLGPLPPKFQAAPPIR